MESPLEGALSSYFSLFQQKDQDKILDTSRREKARADAEYMRQVKNSLQKICTAFLNIFHPFGSEVKSNFPLFKGGRSTAEVRTTKGSRIGHALQVKVVNLTCSLQREGTVSYTVMRSSAPRSLILK